MTNPQAMIIPIHSPAGAGLEPWPPIDAKDVASGNPQQRGRYYFNDPTLGLYCGVWDCTAFEGTMAPYSVDEFMILLEGSVTIKEASGRKTIFKAGDCFVIPRGLECAWSQSGYVRKIFAIFEDPKRPVPKKPACDHAIKIDLEAELQPCASPDPSAVLGRVPEWKERQFYKDESGQLSIGLWQSTPYERKIRPFPGYELMHVVEGSSALTSPSGTNVFLTPGDTGFVVKDTPIGWVSKEKVKKIYCTLTLQ